MRLLQKFPKSENRRGILPRNTLKINDLSGKMPDLFAAKFDFCNSLKYKKLYIFKTLLIKISFKIKSFVNGINFAYITSMYKMKKLLESPSAQSRTRVILWDEDTESEIETIKKKKKLNYSSNFVNPPKYKNVNWSVKKPYTKAACQDFVNRGSCKNLKKTFLS